MNRTFLTTKIFQNKSIQKRNAIFMASMFCALFSIAQPTVFYTNFVSSGGQITIKAPSLDKSFDDNFTRISLEKIGGFKQGRFYINPYETASSNKPRWAFHEGTPGAPDYNNNWRPYEDDGSLMFKLNDIIVPNPSNKSGALYNSGSGGQDGYFVFDPVAEFQKKFFYTVNIQNKKDKDCLSAIWGTDFEPAVIGEVNFSSPFCSSAPVTIEVATETPLSSGEYLYITYTTDAWVTQSLVEVISGIVEIPAQAVGTNIEFYAFSSSKKTDEINEYAVNDQILSQAFDMVTLNLKNNGGANYKYTVSANNTLTLASASGTNMQTKCLSTSITNITYNTTGATGIASTSTNYGLPAGVSASFAANTITISGTPSASGTFNYTILLTGGCGSVNATGSIIVSNVKNLTTGTCFATIQNAIDVANANDIVQIPPGTYAENLVVNKNLTFQFTADNDVTFTSITVASTFELKHNKSFTLTTFTNNGIYTSKGFNGKLVNTGTVAPKQP